ncbi:Hsp20 family protein [Aurantivibrio plasticivorans]
MRNFDLSPFYRSSIGFDRIANLLDGYTAERNQPNYPPYNIELSSEDHYRISMAVAGFSESELSIEVEQNQLVVRGKKTEEESDVQYLHQGIAKRNFERAFRLADHVRVDNAKYENGLLHINLVRELPEVMKPRTIEIQSGGGEAQAKIQSVKSQDQAA